VLDTCENHWAGKRIDNMAAQVLTRLSHPHRFVQIRIIAQIVLINRAQDHPC